MTQQNPPAQGRPFTPLAALQGPLLEGATRGGALCARSLFTWQRELIGFAARRLRENGEAGAALLRCRTPAEVAAVQQDWLRTALDSYATESDRLLTVASEAAESLAAEAQAVCRPFAVPAAAVAPEPVAQPAPPPAAEAAAEAATEVTAGAPSRKKEKPA